MSPAYTLPRPRDKTCRRAQVESLGIFDKGEEVMGSGCTVLCVDPDSYADFCNLKPFNNSVFAYLEALTYLDPSLRGDDGPPRTFVIPAKAGIQGISKHLPANS